MRRLRIIALLAFAVLIVAAHVALWSSPDWTAEAKLRLTVLNALGWAAVILPALAVSKWAAMHGALKGNDTD